ncbi:hypothetical protein U9M48_012125 [Paspalum notatum var. saurae]|uniref:SWIM-type domain-containing protein n=1 Tax=Paspalum notatum var. saurae TaxID=547442 RepID=A0AAQ3WI14_PASNO
MAGGQEEDAAVMSEGRGQDHSSGSHSSVVVPDVVAHGIAGQRLISSVHEDGNDAGSGSREADDGEPTTKHVVDDVGPSLIVPEIGMCFESEKTAYDMYNDYAGRIGFSIRRSHTKHRVDGTISQKYIVCNHKGFQENTESSKSTTRTGCKARVQFRVSREGIWTVQKVMLDHNHYLASPNKSHKLRSQRHVIEADRQLIAQIREAGMKPAQVYDFIKEFYGGADKVPFSRMDCNNEIGRERNKYLEANDAQTLLEYLKNKQIEDPTFFMLLKLIKKMSILDYACFGDAVSFDTTFQTNKFEMPFAPFLGTNHHKQTIIFGIALLFNETIESFVWLFETFLIAMSGKHPSTIFTDQDAAMAGVVAYVFPNTSHRLCIWHIYLNAAKHLGHVINKHPDKFMSEFKRCNELLTKYGLVDNSWLLNLYELREKWAAVYRDCFTPDMTSTQRSEGMNNVFKKRFRRKLGLSELLAECDKVSTTLRENELDEDFKSRIKNPVHYIQNFPLFRIAAESYTRRMCVEFEEEFKRQLSYSGKLLHTEGSISTFVVTHMQSNYGATVVFNSADTTITCSCRKYESIGILCKHAFKVFNTNDVCILPSQYILNRWTQYAKKGFYIEKKGSEKENLKAHAARLSRMATSLALKCSVSKPLLDDLEKALHKLDLEADDSLSKMQENEAPLVSTECVVDATNSAISFRVPRVVKGAKGKRAKSVVEKKAGKKKKSSQNKGEDPNKAAQNGDDAADPNQSTSIALIPSALNFFSFVVPSTVKL